MQLVPDIPRTGSLILTISPRSKTEVAYIAVSILSLNKFAGEWDYVKNSELILNG